MALVNVSTTLSNSSMSDDMQTIAMSFVLVSGTASLVMCLLVLFVVYYAVTRANDARELHLTVNLGMFLVIATLDVAWSLKFGILASLDLTDSGDAQARCDWFGGLEVFFSLARLCVGDLYFVQILSVVYGFSAGRAALLGRVFAVLTVWIVMAAAILAVIASGRGWVQLRRRDTWCWFHDTDDSLLYLLGYVWEWLQAVIAVAALLLPVAMFHARKRCDSERLAVVRALCALSVAQRDALFYRGMMGIFGAVVLVSQLLVRVGTSGGSMEQSTRESMRVTVSAVLVPLLGFVDAVLFFWSEPGLLTAVLRAVLPCSTSPEHLGDEASFTRSLRQLELVHQDANDSQGLANQSGRSGGYGPIGYEPPPTWTTLPSDQNGTGCRTYY